jgi:hypothetical protein
MARNLVHVGANDRISGVGIGAWRLTREHQGCPYPGAHQKEEKERNLFASLDQYSNMAQSNLLDVFPM